jgi:hypothetical protein
MKPLRKLALLPALLLATGLLAQTGGPSVSQNSKPGDTVRYHVTFDDDPRFTRIDLYFRLRRESPADQKGIPAEFRIIYTGQPVAPGTFDVQGSIPECATGTYDLTEVDARVGDAVHTYTYPANGQGPVTLVVKNDQRNLFPSLKSVSPNPPRP